jgi:hypothetical protein
MKTLSGLANDELEYNCSQYLITATSSLALGAVPTSKKLI